MEDLSLQNKKEESEVKSLSLSFSFYLFSPFSSLSNPLRNFSITFRSFRALGSVRNRVPFCVLSSLVLTSDSRFRGSDNVVVEQRAGVYHTSVSRWREIQRVCAQVRHLFVYYIVYEIVFFIYNRVFEIVALIYIYSVKDCCWRLISI